MERDNMQQKRWRSSSKPSINSPNGSGGETMGAWAKFAQTHQDASGMTQSRYLPPSDVQKMTIRSALSLSNRGRLGSAQFDLLDKGAVAGSDGLVLHMAGNVDLLNRRSIAVIGTRDISEIGIKRAHKFARELAEAQIVVVSGLAKGVDTVALSSAIKAGGQVVAVIGTPINTAYPAANSRLQELIYEEHLLVSQFNAGERVFPSNFPARNRTMAALSDGSVIIEAGESSGTLHQASECVRLNRWLGISKSVVENPNLSWPAKFLEYSRCVILENTADFITKIYGE